MADNKKKNDDLYKVLGLRKECTASELRNAYKKLALRWHPDRCLASEEAKKKFQAIQQAYSVLSDTNKRMMYDVGVYDSDDDDCELGEFLDEMVAMMDETKPTGEESFEELMELFEEMFEGEEKEESGSNSESFCSASSSTTFASYPENSSSTSKSNSGERSSGKGKTDDSFNLATHFLGFSMGVSLPLSLILTLLRRRREAREKENTSKRKEARAGNRRGGRSSRTKLKFSSTHDYGVSA